VYQRGLTGSGLIGGHPPKKRGAPEYCGLGTRKCCSNQKFLINPRSSWKKGNHLVSCLTVGLGEGKKKSDVPPPIEGGIRQNYSSFVVGLLLLTGREFGVVLLFPVEQALFKERE